MSHELRTPLNSSLILAKLLADNKTGNLTRRAGQVRGDDLLRRQRPARAHQRHPRSVEDRGGQGGSCKPSRCRIAHAVDRRPDEAVPGRCAAQKGLALRRRRRAGRARDASRPIAQRLGQILKNLLSNAFKFTDTRLSVAAACRSSVGRHVTFAVRDTGIGIPAAPEERHLRSVPAGGRQHSPQVRRHRPRALDFPGPRASARRRHPGPESARPGQHVHAGAARSTSRHTLRRPIRLQELAFPRRHTSSRHALLPRAARYRRRPPMAVDDDREHLVTGIADDPGRGGRPAVSRHPARSGARDGLPVRRRRTRRTTGSRPPCRYHPSAILLDINLPDHSGLGVLDQLKRNPQPGTSPCTWCRSQTIRSRRWSWGPWATPLKPVKREAARRGVPAPRSEVLHQACAASSWWKTTSASATASASCSARRRAESWRWRQRPRRSSNLQATTFDCMVMDLNLPDIERLRAARNDGRPGRTCSFPPVIVYTGARCRASEEQRLRRFSQSIIIKDARSPERLLDEVTLFLHQVESALPPERQRMLQAARDRDAALEGRRILVVEDDVRNIFALSSVLEPKGARVEIARNGREALDVARPQRRPGRRRHRPGPDGHHDARDGRPHGDARDPQAARMEEAADHRADRQGDEGRSGEVSRGRAPTTTSPSRSTWRSCCRWCACGCRSEAGRCRPTNFDIELQLLHRRDLPEVSLRLP